MADFHKGNGCIKGFKLGKTIIGRPATFQKDWCFGMIGATIWLRQRVNHGTREGNETLVAKSAAIEEITT